MRAYCDGSRKLASRQAEVEQCSRPFTFLKFRSMECATSEHNG